MTYVLNKKMATEPQEWGTIMETVVRILNKGPYMSSEEKVKTLLAVLGIEEEEKTEEPIELDPEAEKIIESVIREA